MEKKKKMNKIIDIGKSVIKTLRIVCPDAIIAGGWVREQIFKNNDPKDIDIWTSHTIPKEQILELFPTLENLQIFTTRIDARLNCVLKFVLDGVDIDIMVINHEYIPEGGNITDTFDFNICRCWTEDGETLEAHDSFWVDYKEKLITYNKTVYNDANVKRILTNHLPRLQEKFPDFEVRGTSDISKTLLGMSDNEVSALPDNSSR